MLEIIEAAKEYQDCLNSFNETHQAQLYKHLSTEFKAQTIAFFKKGGTVTELLEQLGRQSGVNVEQLKGRVEKYEKKHGAHIQEDITQDPKIGRTIAYLNSKPKAFIAVSATSTAVYLSSPIANLDNLRFPLLSGPRKGQEVSMKELQEKKAQFKKCIKATGENLKTAEACKQKIQEIRKEFEANQIQDKMLKKAVAWLLK